MRACVRACVTVCIWIDESALVGIGATHIHTHTHTLPFDLVPSHSLTCLYFSFLYRLRVRYEFHSPPPPCILPFPSLSFLYSGQHHTHKVVLELNGDGRKGFLIAGSNMKELEDWEEAIQACLE